MSRGNTRWNPRWGGKHWTGLLWYSLSCQSERRNTRRRRIIEEDEEEEKDEDEDEEDEEDEEEEEEKEEDISGDNVNDPCALLTLVRTQPPVEKRK